MPREKKQKGLSDKELIEKYEAGKIELEEAVQEMLDEPSKTADKTDKQKKHKDQ